jgi:K+-transporting ATPase ATPase C chain
MIRELRTAAVALLLMTILTGVAYPVGVWCLAQALFPVAANGGALPGGKGAALVGQAFTAPGYFWPRPSATEPAPYNALAGAASNLGPSNPALAEAVRARVAAARAANPRASGDVPADLVTASGSGLDPHLSPAAAAFQVARVAEARGIPEADVRALVARFTEGPTLGILGAPRVHVVRLNLALDQLRGAEGAP